MRELGSELWGLIGLVVDVTRGGVECDSGEHGNGLNLGEMSRSVQAKDVSGDLRYLCGGGGDW